METTGVAIVSFEGGESGGLSFVFIEKEAMSGIDIFTAQNMHEIQIEYIF